MGDDILAFNVIDIVAPVVAPTPSTVREFRISEESISRMKVKGD